MKKLAQLLTFATSTFILAAVSSVTPAQEAALAPIPVEGTDMVATEHGVDFPREIVWPKDGSTMVLIPQGSFTMGLSPDKGGDVNEGPEREVELPSFYIDKFEITNAQYNAFLLDNPGGLRPRPTASDRLLEPARPVVAIPWRAANAYSEWAGKQLPTEAMWEKAARGPENTIYTTGNSLPSEETVIANRGAAGLSEPVNTSTGDVSGYGVLHMGGNVSEWVSDWYARDYYSLAPRENPQGPEVGETKVIRGGNFFAPVERTRTTFRTAQPATHVRDEVGFRTVWIPTPPVPEEERPTPTPSPTPMPTTEEVLADMIKELTPYIERAAPRLPREMMAGRAYTTGGEDEIQFINFTPFSITLSALGPNEELVFKYNEPLAAMTYRNIPLTRERDLYLIAYAKDAPRTGPLNIGFIRAESRAIIVIKTELFSPLVDKRGEEIPLSRRTDAEQYYGAYNPMWNEMEIQNQLDEPLLVKIENITSQLEGPEPVGEFTLDGNQILRVDLRPGRYRFTADYIGAMGPSGDPREILINDRAARRLVTVRQDTGRTDQSVMVITERRPLLVLELNEARALGFRR